MFLMELLNNLQNFKNTTMEKVFRATVFYVALTILFIPLLLTGICTLMCAGISRILTELQLWAFEWDKEGDWHD